jgi:F-type H+-transporting ATPase subunit b
MVFSLFRFARSSLPGVISTMEETLRQLGGLVLGAIPTLVLFVLTYIGYRFLVHRPLERVLEERRQRTEGAMERARADISAAEAKAQDYEQRLREARVSVFKVQEGRRQRAVAARAAAVAEARKAAEVKVQAAKASLEQDMVAAQASLRAETDRLANEIVRTILKPVAIPAGGAE